MNGVSQEESSKYFVVATWIDRESKIRLLWGLVRD